MFPLRRRNKKMKRFHFLPKERSALRNSVEVIVRVSWKNFNKNKRGILSIADFIEGCGAKSLIHSPRLWVVVVFFFFSFPQGPRGLRGLPGPLGAVGDRVSSFYLFVIFKTTQIIIIHILAFFYSHSLPACRVFQVFGASLVFLVSLEKQWVSP